MRKLHIHLGLTVFLLASLPQTAPALGLGKLVVLSSLGEPLRAEIEVPELTPTEASTLQLTVSEPSPYQTPGVNYPSLDRGLQVELLRRSDGQPYLSLKSQQDIKEPLIGIVLDLKWRSGRLMRDYLMLLSPGETSAHSTQAKDTSSPVSASPVASKNTLQTHAGDTAGALAAKIKPDGANLEQALLALVQENPAAFIEGNANRMRAGVILDIPDPAKIIATSPSEAHRWTVEQNEAFDTYRGALAKNALKRPAQSGLELELQAPGHSASGTIQALPPEASTERDPSDKLTLSQAKKSAQEALLAEEKQAKAQAERLAELKKNIGELNQLQTPPPESPQPETPKPDNQKSDATAVVNVPLKDTFPEKWAWLGGLSAALALVLSLGGWLVYRRRTRQPNSSPLRAASATTDFIKTRFDADPGDEDPLLKADQLIQAGQLDAAEDHLKTALRYNPALLTAQAKLLEVYALRTHDSGLKGWNNAPTSSESSEISAEEDDFELDTAPPAGMTPVFQELPNISLDLNDGPPKQ